MITTRTLSNGVRMVMEEIRIKANTTPLAPSSLTPGKNAMLMIPITSAVTASPSAATVIIPSGELYLI